MEVSAWFWIGFHIVVGTILALDLGIVGKTSHKISLKEALTWTSIWVSVALLFNLFIYFRCYLINSFIRFWIRIISLGKINKFPVMIFTSIAIKN